jgi:hypothetical protein
MTRFSRISIQKSTIDDLFYMPLAEISFYLDTHFFVYQDYINPFTNGLIDFFVRQTFSRHGDEKIRLCQNIAERLALHYHQAVDIFNGIVPLINQYILENPSVQVEFPSYDAVMRLAYRNGFKPDNAMSLNFMSFRQGVELHIRAKTVASAMSQLLEYEEDGSVFEQHTLESVRKICNEYQGLRVAVNQTDRSPEKLWIMYEDLDGFHEKPHYFDCLRDIVNLLPLPKHCQYHEEPYYE